MREDRARQELFRRIKAEVRGSDQYLLVGIDVAKDRHHAFFGTPNGKVLCKNLVFDNDRVGFGALRERSGSLQKTYGLAEVVYGLEPTASYHKPLAEYLIGIFRGHLINFLTLPILPDTFGAWQESHE